VGKSTLLNRLLGEKVAITASKPQTTRHRILGVLTEPHGQLIFWDTPGLHLSERLLNQEMISLSKAALADADVVLWVVDAIKRGLDHHLARDMTKAVNKPLIVAINKVDKVPKEGQALLDQLTKSLNPGSRGSVFQVSAKSGHGLYELKNELYKSLPPQELLYPPDTLTDQPLRVLVGEMVREAVFRLTSQEIPYATAVTVEEFNEPFDKNPFYFISATIHVEKENQKKMVIGHTGKSLKAIGQTARLSLEKFLDCRVFLRLFVRVTKDWSKHPQKLQEFGYAE
jgi:GTP-binding protein Era